MTFKNLVALVPMALLLTTGVAQAATADAILGTWSPDGGRESKIEINKCGNLYCGVIVWMKLPRNDDKNTNAAQRKRPLVSTKIMTNFKFEGGSKWGGGQLYDPKTGKTSAAKLELVGKNDLEIFEPPTAAKKTGDWKRVVQ